MKAAVQVCQNTATLDNYGDATKNITQVIRMVWTAWLTHWIVT